MPSGMPRERSQDEEPKLAAGYAISAGGAFSVLACTSNPIYMHFQFPLRFLGSDFQVLELWIPKSGGIKANVI